MNGLVNSLICFFFTYNTEHIDVLAEIGISTHTHTHTLT